MSTDTPMKSEPIELSVPQHQPLVFVCQPCDIRFSSRNTLDAHRQHYCPKRQTSDRHSTDLPISRVAQSLKRKFTGISESAPTKRLSLLSHDSTCRECHVLADKRTLVPSHQSRHCPQHLSDPKPENATVSFNRPVQIGRFIYVPVPIRPSQIHPATPDSKPLDLSKPKQSVNDCRISTVLPNSSADLAHKQLYRCEFCSVHFRSLKTLRAHQDNYCAESQKLKKDENNQVTDTLRSPWPTTFPSKSLSVASANTTPRSTLFICRLCHYRGNTLRGMRTHFKIHIFNREPCSNEDIIKCTTNVPELPPTLTHPVLKCTICSAMFDREETLLNHIRSIHTHERFLKCLQCQSRFCSKWNLIRHMKFTHTSVKYEPSDSKNLVTRQIEVSSADDNRPAEKTLSCMFCRSTFQNAEIFKQHMVGCCSAQARTKDILDDIRKKMANETFCSLCQISFQYKASYDAHRLYYCPGGSTQNRAKLLA